MHPDPKLLDKFNYPRLIAWEFNPFLSQFTNFRQNGVTSRSVRPVF